MVTPEWLPVAVENGAPGSVRMTSISMTTGTPGVKSSRAIPEPSPPSHSKRASRRSNSLVHLGCGTDCVDRIS